MANRTRLDRLYAQMLCHHPYGWALYKKVTKRDIFPGSCGYFDAEGDWHTLVNLTDASRFPNGQGWSSPDDEIRSSKKPESMTWGPKYSGSIELCSVGGAVGSSATGAPANASLNMLFTSKSDTAAVLATESPVLRHNVGDKRSALQWMVDNKSEMLRQHGDVLKTHGIWIVTKTYTTRRCAIAIMTSKSSAVEIGLQADVHGALTLMQKSSWTNSTGDACIEMHEDDEDGVVVFISGIYFSKRLLRTGIKAALDQEKQKDKIFRGGDNEDALGLNNGDGSEYDMRFYPPLDRQDDSDDDSNYGDNEDEV